MKKSFLMFLTLTIFVALFACGEDKNPTEPNKNANIITTVPKFAFVGDTITVVGKNFGDSQETGFVFFAGTLAKEYITWSDYEIVVKVPEGAESGKLWIEVNGEKSNEVDFTILYEKANIRTIIPQFAYIGDTIKVSGTNFGEIQGTSFVSFAGTIATEYITWGDNEIEVKVPEGAVSGKLWLEINGEKGNEVDFTLKTIEPKVYETITIGEQEWLLRNLDVTHYRNGDPIRHAVSEKDWINANINKEGAWSYYNNDPANEAIYGKLYNWYAVNDPRGLAPKDYHVPSDTEWSTLTTYLNKSSKYWCNYNSNEIAKSISAKEFWMPANNTCAVGNNLNVNNSSGFTALPCGLRSTIGTFDNLRYLGLWWSSTENNDTQAWVRIMFCSSTYLGSGYDDKDLGLSVRCIKD